MRKGVIIGRLAFQEACITTCKLWGLKTGIDGPGGRIWERMLILHYLSFSGGKKAADQWNDRTENREIAKNAYWVSRALTNALRG
jgi:hypothetical protein